MFRSLTSAKGNAAPAEPVRDLLSDVSYLRAAHGLMLLAGTSVRKAASRRVRGGYASRRPMWTFLRRRTLTQWILVSMVLGIALGALFPAFAISLRPISTVFLRMIKSIIAPLIFGTLVVGIAGHGDDMKRVGRLALKSLIYFEVVTTLALLIGLAAVNLTRPGVGVTLEAPAQKGAELAAQQTTLAGVLAHIVPTSVFEAAAKNEVLQLVL